MAKLRMPRPPRAWTIAQRMAYYSAAQNEAGCILWKGSTRPDGYGEIYWSDRLWRSHRVAWTLANGPIPDDLIVCHRCDVPACVNPSHLFLGSHADNTQDKVRKGRHFRGDAISRRQRGENNRWAKISEADALAIKAAPGTQREIAEKYGITPSAVSLIKLGKNWGHLGSCQ